uniref:Protein arginine N-methyltransferase n=1 Tax=Echinostoma caproni TaxID=27848 RepID=A0A183A120_9TREM
LRLLLARSTVLSVGLLPRSANYTAKRGATHISFQRTLRGTCSILSEHFARPKYSSSMAMDSSPDCPLESTEYELVPQFNPTIGRTQWKPVRTDYDYAQEIALSGYGDMLHDTDRNQKYAEAIRVAIRHIQHTQPDIDLRVLDIGTGTGLLSMMAASQGAHLVTACEAFRPMANCAKQVLQENQLEKYIKVVGKQSTKLTIPDDLPQRANLLVAELVDTELIGEACLSTYKHAAESLLTPDAVLVPYGADLFCQVGFSFVQYVCNNARITTVSLFTNVSHFV